MTNAALIAFSLLITPSNRVVRAEFQGQAWTAYRFETRLPDPPFTNWLMRQYQEDRPYSAPVVFCVEITDESRWFRVTPVEVGFP